jgi:hypothetical protein
MTGITETLAAPAGRALAAMIEVVGRFRGPRPIHTTGLLLTGRLRWYGRTAARSGIAWIDDRPSGDVSVVGRLSRGAALPAALPDVIGLALRIGDDQGDLLLSSTGIGVPGRFVLQPRRSPAGAVLSTLMPYRGALGPVLIAARSVSPARISPHLEEVRGQLAGTPWRLELLHARPAELWHRFAEVELVPAAGVMDAAEPRFDPILRPPAGAGTYGWTRALREQAYAAGRASPAGPASR